MWIVLPINFQFAQNFCNIRKNEKIFNFGLKKFIPPWHILGWAGFHFFFSSFTTLTTPVAIWPRMNFLKISVPKITENILQNRYELRKIKIFWKIILFYSIRTRNIFSRYFFFNLGNVNFFQLFQKSVNLGYFHK